MKRMTFALLSALAGCAATPPAAAPVAEPTYTRARIAGMPTPALARMLLPPEQAADVLRHNVRRSVYHEGQDLDAVDFYRSPYVLAPDICLRERIMVSFTDAVPNPRRQPGHDVPKRVDRVTRIPEIVLVPNCANLPGRSFAHLSGDLALVDGVQILRTIAAARALAEGSQPLPYRLLCVPLRGEAAPCTGAERAAFAAMPLHAVYRIARRPGPASCRPEDALGGDLLFFDREGPGFWQVRMIGLAGADATVVVSADGRRVACL
ncbi:MAG TPA: hypothetical protein VEZ20_06615 [Allosphingosinicella sp.]|nr:hypothetical protein [Allosphingosinicella sp.]